MLSSNWSSLVCLCDFCHILILTHCLFQVLAAECISRLCLLCVGRMPCPTPKIIKNLITMLCSDPSFTPVIGQEMSDATATGKTIM